LFKIYYGDESIVEVSVDQIESAPRLNVQAIAWGDTDSSADTVGRHVLQQGDYYLYAESLGRFIQCNGETDLIDHVLHDGPMYVFKGRTIRDDLYRKIIKRAYFDPGLPPKSRDGKLEGRN
jgi:hypothetical protein